MIYREDAQFEARLNWRGAWLRRMRDTLVLILSVPTSTSAELGTLSVTREQVRRLSAAYGIPLLSRSGQFADAAHRGTVLMTKCGLVATVDGQVLAMIAQDALHGSGGVISDEQSIGVIITPAVPSGYRNLKSLLEANPGGQAGFMARAVVPTTRASSGRYGYANSSGEVRDTVPSGATVIVDQSVLVDAERSIRVEQPRTFEVAELRDHVTWLQFLDVVPGFGIGECASGDGGVERAERLREAWKLWIRGGSPDADPLGRLRVSVHTRKEDQDSHEDVVTSQIGRGLASLNYLALLEVLDIWADLRGKPFVAEQRVEAFERWVGRINQPHAGNPGHMGAAIRTLLLDKGRGADQAASLLKVGGSRTPRVRDLGGAAYDLVYPTICDMANAGILPELSSRETWVMSADIPMLRLRGNVLLVSGPIVKGGDGILRIDTSYKVHYSERLWGRVANAEHHLVVGARQRLRSASLENMTMMIDKRERELTSGAFLDPL